MQVPVQSTNIPSVTPIGSKEDTYDLLKDTPPPADDKVVEESDDKDEQAPVKAKGKAPKEDEPPQIDDKELEEEIEQEPTEDDLQLVTPVRRQAILKKYPQLFKDFPQLQSAYYRDQKFSEIFGTVEEAQQARSRVETLEKFESEMMQGTVGGALKSLRDAEPESFARVVDNLMNDLRAVDPMAANHIHLNLVKGTVQAMVQEANLRQNTDLQTAAHLLYQFYFGATNFTPPANFAKTEAPKKDESLDVERQRFEMERATTYGNEMTTRINNSFKATIEKHIDPSNKMPAYVRMKAIEDALTDVQGRLQGSEGFRKQLGRHWENAHKAGYSSHALEGIRSFVLARGKEVLSDSILKARRTALQGLGPVKTEDEPQDKTPVTPGRASSSERRGGNSDKNMPKPGESTMDFLSRD